MFKSTKTFGYSILGLVVFFLVVILILIASGCYYILFMIGIIIAVIIPCNCREIIPLALKLIGLDLYVGDTISFIFSTKESENEEDYTLRIIGFLGPEFYVSDGTLILPSWDFLVNSSITLINTKAHAPSKRRVEQIFTFHIEDMDKIEKFIKELQKRLEQEKSFKDVLVDFFYEENEVCYHINSVRVKAVVYIDAGRENFMKAKTKINLIALGASEVLELT